jgi:predicted metalloprotease with PDZ domain
VFGGLPYERYLFLTLLSDRGRGGLEHREACTLLAPRFGFRPEKARQEFYFLCAHELFHAWVVKRLRPLQLTPYRYRAEGFTRLLWFFEGFTSYYETLLVLRARLCTPARFLEVLGERMTQMARTPGRRVQSVEEASLAAWIKYYRPDENSPNSSISYYLKGSLVALQLEAELRRRSKSLDELMRRLWERYGVGETGVPENAVRLEAEALAGEPLPALFEWVVAGTADPDYETLAALGLQAKVRAREGPQDKGGSKPKPERGENGATGGGTLGVLFKPERTVIQTVLTDSPAERAGLCADDEVVAADGYRLAPGEVSSRLESLQPGSLVRLAYFRRDELRETHVVLGERPLDTWWIEKSENASEAQRAAWTGWTGWEW